MKYTLRFCKTKPGPDLDRVNFSLNKGKNKHKTLTNNLQTL